MPSREELLQNIQPGMKLDKNFFLRIYGYSITTPEFTAEALESLETAGCSKARSYYESIIQEYETKCRERIRPVAEEYARELDKKWSQEGSEERRRQKKEELLRRKRALLMQKSKELIGN